MSKKYPYIILMLCLCAILVPLGTAVKIIEKTDPLVPENFQVTINDFSDSALFQLIIEGNFEVEQGKSYSFGVKNFVMPYNLKDAVLTVNVENSNDPVLVIKKGDIVLKKEADKNGTISIAQDISAVTYDMIKINGTSGDKKNTIKIKIQMNGVKYGPKSSSLSLTTEGIKKGEASINLYIDKAKVFSTIQKIGTSPILTANPSISPGKTQKTVIPTIKTTQKPTPDIVIKNTTISPLTTSAQIINTTTTTPAKPIINFSRPQSQVPGLKPTINPLFVYKK